MCNMQQMSSDMGQSLYPRKTQTLESCAGRQGAVCNMWKPMLQDHCRESREEEELRSEQEEADTGLLLHVQHAANEQRYGTIIVSSEDKDVRILCLAFSFSIDVPIYQRCVSQLNARYVDIGKIAHDIGQDACRALPGLHAFTGCDAVSAFAGMGK